jgi:hypothetical protein
MTGNLLRTATVTTNDEWIALVVVLADVQEGHGLDLHVREAAAFGSSLLSRRGGVNAGVCRHDPDQDQFCLRMMEDAPATLAARLRARTPRQPHSAEQALVAQLGSLPAADDTRKEMA